MTSTPRSADMLAAIDIGSNSFRLEIARVNAGRYRRVAYHKKVVRLGGDLDEQGRLREAGAQRGLDCLAEFAEALKGMPASSIRAVATQTLREAVNRDEFLSRARGAGPPDRSHQRARGSAAHLRRSFLPATVAGAAAGHRHRRPSTELILGRERQPRAAKSFPVGSVSLSMRHFPDGGLSASAFHDAQVAAGAHFDEALGTFSRQAWHEAMGASGTVGAVSDILAGMGLTDGRITLRAPARLMEVAIAAGDVSRLELPGLEENRRAALPGGLAILDTLRALFGIDNLHSRPKAPCARVSSSTSTSGGKRTPAYLP